jgi:hypothetical protein
VLWVAGMIFQSVWTSRDHIPKYLKSHLDSPGST